MREMRLRAQILVRADGRGAQLRVLRLERPADEGREALGLVLLGAHPFEVLDAVLHRLHVAEHHGGGRIQPEPMRDVHDLQPIVAHRFQRRNALAHPVHQDFAAAARDRTQARRFEVGNDLLQRLAENLAEMDELARAEAVDVDLRKLTLYMREQVQIPLLGELGMVPALQQNLRPPSASVSSIFRSSSSSAITYASASFSVR